jgi:hypothetical protein
VAGQAGLLSDQDQAVSDHLGLPTWSARGQHACAATRTREEVGIVAELWQSGKRDEVRQAVPIDLGRLTNPMTESQHVGGCGDHCLGDCSDVGNPRKLADRSLGTESIGGTEKLASAELTLAT